MPTPPWKQKPQPTGATKTTLTPESIAWARERAKQAGRRYPNLIDNMAATRRQLEAEHPISPGPGSTFAQNRNPFSNPPRGHRSCSISAAGTESPPPSK